MLLTSLFPSYNEQLPNPTSQPTLDLTIFYFSFPELYSPHHSTMSHQLTPDSSRLASSVCSTPTYSLPPSVSYPTTLLPPSSTTTSHMSHQLSPVSVTSSYQQNTSHQLPPTPNSLVTLMGPNSNSNPAPDQLTSTELPISSVSPVQHHQQQQQQQNSQGNTSPSWNLTIPSSGNRVGLPSPPPNHQQHHSTYPHQGFANHYSQSFQQPPRPGAQQHFYWHCWDKLWEKIWEKISDNAGIS